MRGVRWVTAGLVDQVVMGGANAANTLLAVGLLETRARAGTMLLSLGLGYLVLSVNRAFVGEVLLTQAPRLSGEDHRRLIRHGLAAAVAVGVLAALVMLGVWAFWRHPGKNIDLPDLVWLAPFLPAILLHDTGRYTYLSEREPGQALVIDLIWVGSQATVIAGMIVFGSRSPGLLLASWGIGAVVGASAFLLRSGAEPWRGDPRRWLSETRHLSGWFTATSLVGQVNVQAINFLVAGRLSRTDLAVLRSGQSVLLQPVNNFAIAMMGLLVPRSSRLVGGGDAAGLRRQTVRVAAAFAGLAALMVALVVPVVHVLGPHLGRYADIAPLALPISVQAGIYLLQIPFTAAVRGMQRGAMLFTQYLLFAAASLSGLMIGARHGHLLGAAWGLTAGAVLGLAVMIALYAWCAARIRPVQIPETEVVAGATAP
jgi:O-antigen/teichoic acid export membrane protein